MDKRPRGRPRPQETVDRDTAILAQLRLNGPQTRNQLAASLGVSLTKTYLALDRLRQDGKVRICADTAGPGSVWSADVEAPCP